VVKMRGRTAHSSDARLRDQLILIQDAEQLKLFYTFLSCVTNLQHYVTKLLDSFCQRLRKAAVISILII